MSLCGKQDVRRVRMLNRHTTLLNHVLHVQAETDDGHVDLYVKLNRDDSYRAVRDEHERAQLLRHHLHHAPRFDTAPVLACHDHPPMLIYAAAKGDSLFATIHRSCERFSSELNHRAMAHAHAAGQWVRATEAKSAPSGSPFTVAQHMINEAETAVRQIRERRYHEAFGPAMRQCIEAISSLADHLPTDRIVLAHGDLHPENLFITDDDQPHITAIDAALSRPQFAGYDARYFCHHLNCSFSHIRYRPAALDQVRAAFIEGYGQPVDIDTPIARAQQALNVLRSLRYLTSLGERGNALRRIWSQWDGRRIARTVTRQAA